MKAKKISGLNKYLAAGNNGATQTKYFVLLPTKEAHGNYHPTTCTSPSGFSQLVHLRIIEKKSMLM